MIFTDANVWIKYHTKNWLKVDPHLERKKSIEESRVRYRDLIVDYICALENNNLIGITDRVVTEVRDIFCKLKNESNDTDEKKYLNDGMKQFIQTVNNINKLDRHISDINDSKSPYRIKLNNMYGNIWNDQDPTKKGMVKRRNKRKRKNINNKNTSAPPIGSDVTILATVWKYKDDHKDEIKHVAFITEDSDVTEFAKEIKALTGIEILSLFKLKDKNRNWPHWVP